MASSPGRQSSRERRMQRSLAPHHFARREMRRPGTVTSVTEPSSDSVRTSAIRSPSCTGYAPSGSLRSTPASAFSPAMPSSLNHTPSDGRPSEASTARTSSGYSGLRSASTRGQPPCLGLASHISNISIVNYRRFMTRPASEPGIRGFLILSPKCHSRFHRCVHTAGSIPCSREMRCGSGICHHPPQARQ
jgi:hypothetical protein